MRWFLDVTRFARPSRLCRGRPRPFSLRVVATRDKSRFWFCQARSCTYENTKISPCYTVVRRLDTNFNFSSSHFESHGEPSLLYLRCLYFFCYFLFPLGSRLGAYHYFSTLCFRSLASFLFYTYQPKSEDIKKKHTIPDTAWCLSYC